MPRFAMTDHDEMTGTQAWVDWQRRDGERRIMASVCGQLNRACSIDLGGDLGGPGFGGAGFGGAGAAAAAMVARPLPQLGEHRGQAELRAAVFSQLRAVRFRS